jgi:hypothetical protein
MRLAISYRCSARGSISYFYTRAYRHISTIISVSKEYSSDSISIELSLGRWRNSTQLNSFDTLAATQPATRLSPTDSTLKLPGQELIIRTKLPGQLKSPALP